MLHPGLRDYLLFEQLMASNSVTRNGKMAEVRGRPVQELLGYYNFTSGFAADMCFSEAEVYQFAADTLGEKLAAREHAGWREVRKDVIRNCSVPLVTDIQTRRARSLNHRSVLEGGEIADFPACWMAIQVQVREGDIHTMGYARSADVALYAVDMGYLIWIGAAFAHTVRQTTEEGVFVLAHSFIGNLHRFMDKEGSDGGIDSETAS